MQFLSLNLKFKKNFWQSYYFRAEAMVPMYIDLELDVSYSDSVYLKSVVLWDLCGSCWGCGREKRSLLDVIFLTLL